MICTQKNITKEKNMSKNDRRIKTSKRNFILALALLLITNILMGVTLMIMSKRTLREQINKRILDVANVAAYQLNGDELGKLTKNDKDTEEYKRAFNILNSFQSNIELDYIYAVKDDGDGTFSYTIDPAVNDDPAEFGETIETTKALINASKGKPDFDKKATSDEWGRFYSAYSPVFDSNGNVAGIVGVDFDADWYDGILNSHRMVAVILTMVAFSVGVVLAAVIMSKNRKNFMKIMSSIENLNFEVQQLDNMILETSVKKLDMLPESENPLLKTLADGEDTRFSDCEECSEIGRNIENLHEKLTKYLEYIDKEVYIDDATRTLNKAAYKRKIKEFDDNINNKVAAFSIGFFDINELKKIYTANGYEAGEKLMFECAKILKKIFGENHVYHVTGDEFIVLMDKKARLDMEEYFVKFDSELKEYNSNQILENKLSVAKGYATYAREKHYGYRSVFVDAKASCDRDKSEYYRKKEQAKTL